MGLLAELKRRNVIRMAGLYLVGAWLLVQVASTLLPAFGAPAGAFRATIVLLALGFPAALVFAWVFELTPDGFKRDEDVPPEHSIGKQTARRMEHMLVVLLLLAVGYFAVDKYVLAPTRATATVAADSRSHAAAAADNSIAVLPFVDMSQGKDQEYFSDGLSEELLNQLAQVPQLRVIARTSSFSFKGREVSIADIARALKVGHVLEGSVRKSGNTLRITAQLIRTSDSSHLWSKTYDRDLTDIFKVQDEISREVVAALKLQLLPGTQPDNTQRTRNPQAYEQYLLGKDVARPGGRGAVEASLTAFQRALALDPNYSNAWAQLSTQQASMADFAGDPAAREAMIDAALASADKAIALAPDLPDGYSARANVRFRMRWDWPGAQSDLARALEMDSNRSVTLLNYAAVLFTLGKREPALEAVRKAVVSDPLSDNAWVALGRYSEGAGDIVEAKKAYSHAMEINPRQNWASFLLGNQLLREGKVDEAIAQYQLAPEQFRTTGMAMAEFTRGNDAASRQLLATMEQDFAVGFAYQIAQIHAWRGEKDQAFAWLERGFPLHDAGLVRMPFDPAMDSLRSDPRFDALVARLGIPK
jgi:TolB-like protein/tetratricopeptide (TPR) repeat protein